MGQAPTPNTDSASCTFDTVSKSVFYLKHLAFPNVRSDCHPLHRYTKQSDVKQRVATRELKVVDVASPMEECGDAK